MWSATEIISNTILIVIPSGNTTILCRHGCVPRGQIPSSVLFRLGPLRNIPIFRPGPLQKTPFSKTSDQKTQLFCNDAFWPNKPASKDLHIFKNICFCVDFASKPPHSFSEKWLRKLTSPFSLRDRSQSPPPPILNLMRQIYITFIYGHPRTLYTLEKTLFS